MSLSPFVALAKGAWSLLAYRLACSMPSSSLVGVCLNSTTMVGSP